MEWKQYRKIEQARERHDLKAWLRHYIGPYSHNNWNLLKESFRGFVEQKLSSVQIQRIDSLPIDKIHNVNPCRKAQITERLRYTIRYHREGERYGHCIEPLNDAAAITIKSTMDEIAHEHHRGTEPGLCLYFDAVVCVKDILLNEGRGTPYTLIRQEITVFLFDEMDIDTSLVVAGVKPRKNTKSSPQPNQ